MTSEVKMPPAAEPDFVIITGVLGDIASFRKNGARKGDRYVRRDDALAAIEAARVEAEIERLATNMERRLEGYEEHEESGKTADELWLETGRLRALLADQDAVVVALTTQLRESSDLVARLRRQVDALIEEGDFR